MPKKPHAPIANVRLRMFCIVNPKGYVSPYSLRWTAKEAREYCTKPIKGEPANPETDDWRNWYREGWRCVPAFVDIYPKRIDLVHNKKASK